MSLMYRIKRRVKATGYASLFKSAYNLSHDKVLDSLLYSHPGLCRYLTPKMRIVCVEPTNFCNLRCRMCIRDSMQRKMGYMSLDLFRTVVDELDRGVDLALYFGGEPLLHKGLAEMLEIAAHKHFHGLSFTTNGMLFTPEVMDAVVKYNVNVRFSLEGLYEVNDGIRVGDDFKVILHNIEELAKRRNKSQISINTVQANQSQAQMKEFVDFFKDLADVIIVNPCRTNMVQLVNRDFFNAETKPVRYCMMPFSFLGVLWNGDVTGCCYDLDGQAIVGNMDASSLKQIWKGKPMTDLRIACLTNTFPSGCFCSGCNSEKLAFVDKIMHTDGLTLTYQGHLKRYERVEP